MGGHSYGAELQLGPRGSDATKMAEDEVPSNGFLQSHLYIKYMSIFQPENPPYDIKFRYNSTVAIEYWITLQNAKKNTKFHKVKGRGQRSVIVGYSCIKGCASSGVMGVTDCC